ncbi:MAG TPA: amidase family protein [Gemmatimonadaceae bacterium]|jgi:Asp-tRNA(Asn)/Glu-tRNA(Gln) amidotransferase A subunit family amidase|nr:amidase family protein [Gemmatimonadaceae bacterium]
MLYIRRTLATVVATATILPAQRPATRPADIVYEASIDELQSALQTGRVTSVQLVDAYLARIAAYDHAGPKLNAIVRLNSRARADAAAMDAERKAGRVRGPLHGIPIILKDNYSTRDLPTSAGSIALAGLETTDDAFQVKKLRVAGAIILAKSNMHELASGITSISSIAGQTCNPYDPRRSPGGSSGGSGAAVAASFAAVAWGSDTCGSIRIPSAVHNLFGLRPTKGLSSIAGIVPLSHTQDVGGPIARGVRDLAIALDATVGPDTADTATRILDGQTPHFVDALDTASLRGKRIGALTDYFGTETDDAEGARVVRGALEKMKTRGAEIVDVSIPGLDSIVNRASVINYEFKFDLVDFLAPFNVPVKSLGEMLDRGLYDTQLEAPLRARESNGTRDGAEYLAALARRRVARAMVIDFMNANHLDAIAYPTVRRKAAFIGEPQRGATCQLSAVTGLPALSMPAGFTPDGMPIGAELLGRPLADVQLVSMAYDYERATRPRVPPSTTPPLVNGRAPAPLAFEADAHGAGTVLHGSLTYDPMRRTLSYTVSASGVAPARVYSISIDRDSAGRKGPVLEVLTVPGESKAAGSVELNAVERADLAAGRLSLVVYTADAPLGSIRAVFTRRP